jgi:alpha/beta superfamily hydrolase
VYGGELTNPVVTAAARGFAELGAATLAFNYRGVRGSEGRVTDDPAAAAEDYTAALDALADRVPGPYLAAGYSFGARTALGVAAVDPRVAGAVLVAPPVDLMSPGALAGYAGPLLVIVGDRDAYAPVGRLRAELPERADVAFEVIEGADHFFGRGTSAISALVASGVRGWF